MATTKKQQRPRKNQSQRPRKSTQNTKEMEKNRPTQESDEDLDQ